MYPNSSYCLCNQPLSCISGSVYRSPHPYISVRTIFVAFIENKAAVDVKVPTVGSMLRPHCAECPSGISSHYCAMLAENTNRKEALFTLYSAEICSNKGQVDS